MGGKSRKSGGVSRQLINSLKGGNFTTNNEEAFVKKGKGSKVKPDAKNKQESSGFGLISKED